MDKLISNPFNLVYRGKALRFFPTLYALLFAALAFRTMWMISQYGVDLFYYDQWDYLKNIIQPSDFWTGFLTPLGPHRLGLAYPLMRFCLELSGFDNFSLMYLSWALSLGNALLFLGLKLKRIGPLHWSDLLIPLIFFDLNQHALYFGNPNVSLYQLPLLFLLLLLWAEPHLEKKGVWISLSVALPFMCFTGNGFFVVVAILLYQLLKRPKLKGELGQWTIILVAGLSLTAYLLCARFRSFDCPQPYADSLLYSLQFIRALVLQSFLLSRSSGWLPWLAFACILGVWLWALLRDVRSPTSGLLLWLYLALFVLATYSARWCYGLDITASSRYLSTLALLPLGFVLQPKPLQPLRNSILLIGIFCFAYGQWKFEAYHRAPLEQWSEKAKAWKACYTESGNALECSKTHEWKPYPVESEYARIEGQMHRVARINPTYRTSD